MILEPRKIEEMEFHDKLREGCAIQRWSPEAEDSVKDDPMWSNFKFYSVERASIILFRKWLEQRAPGATVLDYGCGNGEEAVRAGRLGAKSVVGIDISEIAIRNAAEQAVKAGVSDRVRFVRVDGEHLDFPDNSFDLAMEYGVLHHVNLDAAMQELARVLKPGGMMICTETLGHNPFIRAYRRATPELRTKWEAEHILKRQDFAVIARYFGRIDMHFFHLATLALVPFRHVPGFELGLRLLETIDSVLLRIPYLKWHAWQNVFVLSSPVKP